MLHFTLSALMIFSFGAAAADHNGGNGGEKNREANTPSFKTLEAAYENKNSKKDLLANRLLDGDCHLNPAKAVTDIFNLKRFNANIEMPFGSTIPNAKFSDPTGKIKDAYEDETFHERLIGLHDRSATRDGGVGTQSRGFTIPIVEAITYQQPTYFGPIRTGTKTVNSTAERNYEVAISHETKKATFNGKDVYILKATGNSTKFGWKDTALYYCIFEAK